MSATADGAIAGSIDMFAEHLPYFPQLWRLITRLGDVQIVLSLAIGITLLRMRHPDARPATLRWAALLALAVIVTVASKMAFLGWGFGSAEFNFTGISGHAMFAAAVYPVVFATLACNAPLKARRFAPAAGCAIALLIGLSRVVLDAHSVSEVLAGWFVGGAASVAALSGPPPAPVRIGAKALIAFGLVLGVIAATAPQLNTQSLVTRVALKLSGREHAYRRSAMLREMRRRQGAAATPSLPGVPRSAPVTGSR